MEIDPEQLFLLKKKMTWKELARTVGISDAEVVRSRVRRWRAKHPEVDEKESAKGTAFTHQGPNLQTVSTYGSRITTLEQLIEACDVDLDIWKVRKWGAKKWEGYAKSESTHLDFDGGKATGTIDRGGIETAPLWSIWADFIRKEPIPLFPIIQPIVCQTSYKKPKLPGKGILRALIICDIHAWFRRDPRTAALTPLHDRRVLDLALQIAVAAKVNRIDFLGDLLDMADWTDKFLRKPELKFSMQPTLLELHWWLAQFRRACKEATIKIYEGNHEKRLRDALLLHLEAAYELKAVDELDITLSLPKLLSLRELGIKWIGEYPDELDWLNEGTCLCHGDIARTVPGATARAMAERLNVTTIFGHIHRREWISITRHLQDEIASAACPGCACHVDGRIPGTRGKLNWQQGIALVDYEAEGKANSIVLIEINDGRAIWEGRLFEARDRLPDLQKDLPDWNWQ